MLKANTYILTTEGQVPIQDIRTGMQVLTGDGTWQPVLTTTHTRAPTLLLCGNHYGLSCTPDQPLFTPKGIVQAKDMEGECYLVPNHIDPLLIPQPHPKTFRKGNAMPAMNEDFFYFMGRWLGDGWVRIGKVAGKPNATYGRILICDSLDKEQELRATVEKVAGYYHIVKTKSVVRFEFTNKMMCDWIIENFGKNAEGKYLPSWIFGISDTLQKALFKGYFDSDGYLYQEKIRELTTISNGLALGLRILGEVQGYSTRIAKFTPTPTKILKGQMVNQSTYYRTSLTYGKTKTKIFCSELHSGYKITNITPDGTGDVYEIKVAGGGGYVAEGIVVGGE